MDKTDTEIIRPDVYLDIALKNIFFGKILGKI